MIEDLYDSVIECYYRDLKNLKQNELIKSLADYLGKTHGEIVKLIESYFTRELVTEMKKNLLGYYVDYKEDVPHISQNEYLQWIKSKHQKLVEIAKFMIDDVKNENPDEYIFVLFARKNSYVREYLYCEEKGIENMFTVEE